MPGMPSPLPAELLMAGSQAAFFRLQLGSTQHWQPSLHVPHLAYDISWHIHFPSPKRIPSPCAKLRLWLLCYHRKAAA